MSEASHDAAPPALPRRDPAGHKGVFGAVGVVGGCAHAGSRMIGGPALSALGALRAGAGLARLVAPAPILDAAIVIAPSATGVAVAVDSTGEMLPHEAARAVDEAAASCAAMVVGPGLGRGAGATAAALRAASQEERPVVIDADAIHALAALPELRRDFRAQAVLTPHPGEFRAIGAALGILRGESDALDPALRSGAAERLAQALGAVVVLKGAGTVVSDGVRTWVNGTGTAALATGGTGDVLAGMIAGLAAQFHRAPLVAGSRTVTSEARGGLSLFDCARIAVHAHGLCAERWASRRGASAGLLAIELLEEIPAVLEGLRAGWSGGTRGTGGTGGVS